MDRRIDRIRNKVNRVQSNTPDKDNLKLLLGAIAVKAGIDKKFVVDNIDAIKAIAEKL